MDFRRTHMGVEHVLTAVPPESLFALSLSLFRLCRSLPCALILSSRSWAATGSGAASFLPGLAFPLDRDVVVSSSFGSKSPSGPASKLTGLAADGPASALMSSSIRCACSS